MKRWNYKCAITGSKDNLKIHHVFPFNKLRDLIFQELNIEFQSNIGNYTKDELNKLSEKCIEIHYRYGLGVVLTNDIYNEFHKMYGNRLFTENDFYEFYKYKTGKDFDPSFFICQK